MEYDIFPQHFYPLLAVYHAAGRLRRSPNRYQVPDCLSTCFQGRRAALHMWGQRPKLDDDDTGALSDDEAASEHKRVKSDTDGGFLVRYPSHGREIEIIILLLFLLRLFQWMSAGVVLTKVSECRRKMATHHQGSCSTYLSLEIGTDKASSHSVAAVCLRMSTVIYPAHEEMPRSIFRSKPHLKRPRYTQFDPHSRCYNFPQLPLSNCVIFTIMSQSWNSSSTNI